MKNIYILPTDKPSRLWITKLGNLTRCHDIRPIKEGLGNNVNIYITSDEEIKEGDWFYRDSGIVFKMTEELLDYYESNKSKDTHKRYKIILTTDQDLIKDGVQAIDDEFLEWFVKNPSCEFVEVEKGYAFGIFYKLIIPKEEVKQYSKYLSCCRSKEECYCKEEPKQELPQFGTKEFNDLASDYFGGKPSTKLHKGEVVDESYPKEFKQETLEEVKDLAYYRAYEEEDYLQVPISVLRYISELEERSYSLDEIKTAMKNGYCLK